jgi:peptidoglycan-N-acetylglucosamine deacetylase
MTMNQKQRRAVLSWLLTVAGIAVLAAAVDGVLSVVMPSPAAVASRPPLVGRSRHHVGPTGPSRGHRHPLTTANRENEAIDRLLTRQAYITSGGPERRDVALTFDDGPGPYTPGVIAVLRRYDVPATFFEVGSMLQYFHGSLSAELRELHVTIGDHTETHAMMALLTPSAQRAEITEQAAAIGKYGAPFPRLYRPPYMSYDAATFDILRRLHMLMVLWSVDTSDYLRPGARAIAERALAGAHPGAIILMHDGGGDRSQTIAALPAIISGLRRRHYTRVTVAQLVLDDPPLGPPAHLPTTGAS